MQEWKDSESDCPRCTSETEVLVSDGYSYAKRCKECEWHVGFTVDKQEG